MPLERHWHCVPCPNSEFPFHALSDGPLEGDDYLRVLGWCEVTFGRGLVTDGGMAGRGTNWSACRWFLTPEHIGLTSRFSCRREADRLIFVLAWTGALTP